MEVAKGGQTTFTKQATKYNACVRAGFSGNG